MNSFSTTPPLGCVRPARRRPSAALALTAICLGFLMITLDATIVNVALGPIVRDLGGSLAGAQWVVSGYTVAFASLLLGAGALADRLGARTGFAIGLIVFALGSALCATALSLPMLVVSRVVQGIGAAWLMPCSLALIGHAFTTAPDRRRALAIWGGASGIGLAAGPVLGGVLTHLVGWRAIFLVNVPVALLAAMLLLGHVSETRRHRHELDLPGQLLAVASLTTLTAGFILAGRRGWLSILPAGLLAAGVFGLLALATVERRSARPMIDPAMLRAPDLRTAVAIGAIFNFCLYGALFCLATDLQRGFPLDSFGTGMALLPMTLVTGLTAYVSGPVVKRFGEWTAMIGGLAAGVVAATVLAFAPSSWGVAAVIAASAPLGLTAAAMPAMTAVAIAGAPAHRMGLASGILNAARQTGGAFGVAVLGALLGRAGISLQPPFIAIASLYAIGCGLAYHGLSRHRTRSRCNLAEVPTPGAFGTPPTARCAR